MAGGQKDERGGKKMRRSSGGGGWGRTESREEWIPLNPSGRRRGGAASSSIITTIHHPAKHNPTHNPNHHLTSTTPRPLLASLFLTPAIFFLSYAFAALVSGSIVGWAVAALYNAAFLRMSTWVPALWSAGLTLILIISSYSNISTVL